MKRWIMKPWTNGGFGLALIGFGIFFGIIGISDMDLYQYILLAVVIGCGLMVWVPDLLRRRGKKKQR